MAIEFSLSEWIDAPPEHVYRVATDLDAASEWMQGLVGLEREGSGLIAMGDTWRETRRVFGKEATEHFEVTGMNPPETLSLKVDGTKGASKSGEYRFDYRFEPAHGGTRVSLNGAVDGVGMIASLVGKLFVGAFKKACAADLRAMKIHAEQTRPPR